MDVLRILSKNLIISEEVVNNSTELIGTSIKSLQRFIKMGSNSSLLLYSLIEDILNLSKLEAGTFFTTISSFSVVDVIDEVTEIFEPQWAQKRLQLNVDIDADLQEIKIDSDRGRIKQVILNLMSNAFKFTFRGSISISAKLWENSSIIEFWVKDTGIGIKEASMSKLFNLFAMVDNNKEINPHGWGIGLTVSKKYIEKLGGTIWIESEFEKYTKVIFRIPYSISSIFEILYWNKCNSIYHYFINTNLIIYT